MSDELEPGALSAGPVQGKTKQDSDRSFVAAGELDEFLVRRQLLTMESKRIQTVLTETETENKARIEDLVEFRQQVLAALSKHLAAREKAQREELALRESLERRAKVRNLPKTAEGYVRRKGKQLFARLKPASASTRDSSHTVPVQDLGWHLPKAVQLDAWIDWLAESDSSSRKAPGFRKDRIQVAFVVSGGLGDLLKSTHLLGPISDSFSCDLTVIAAQRPVGEVVARNPYVRDSLVPLTQHVFHLTESLSYVPVFDLIIVWTYNIDYIIPPRSRISRDDIRSIESKSSDLRRMLEKYSFLRAWPTFNFAFSRDMTRLGLSAIKVSVATSGLPHRNPDEIPFFPGKQSLRVVGALLTKRYVTVHHGFDLNYLPAKTRTTDYSSTKNISMEQWRQIVSLLRREGIEVVQLGVVEEEKIEGVTHYLNGLTSLEETGLLIKHGLCHIDTEGGLVHLATAVHARCVVLFGPTPVEFFGYPQNINLEPSGCKACWFTTQTWLIECPRHTTGPECMKGHSAASVAEAAKRIIAESENFSAKLIAAETRSAPKPLAETVAMAQRLLGHNGTSRVLLIFDDPPCDVRSQLSDSVLGGSDVIVCADKPPEPELGGRAEYGSLLNLPRASSSVDAAVWISRELESDIAPFALREIFRVLKPGGQLAFAAVGETRGLDLRRALFAARIAFDEGETSSGLVYSCSLRKNGAQAEGVRAGSGSAVSVVSPGTAQGHGAALDPSLALLEDENTRQITVVRDTFVERQKLVDEKLAVVDDAVQQGFGGDGWIWISNRFADGYPTRFFLSGWHGASDWVIWNRDDKCLLMLPLPEEPLSGGHRLELQLHLTRPESSAPNPIAIGVRVDDGPIENFRLSTDDEILTVLASADSSKFRGLSQVELRLRVEIGHGESEQEINTRVGVRRFRYRLLNS